MKKIIFVLFIVIISIFVISKNQKTQASVSFSNVFGGEIISLSSTELETLENDGYICVMDGTTVSISSTKGEDIEYFIPIYIESKTGYTLSIGQKIAGKTGGEDTTIWCEKCEIDEDGKEICNKDDIILPTITLFGTSKI